MIYIPRENEYENSYVHSTAKVNKNIYFTFKIFEFDPYHSPQAIHCYPRKKRPKNSQVLDVEIDTEDWVTG